MKFDDWAETVQLPSNDLGVNGETWKLLNQAWNFATNAEREACRQECLKVLEETNNIAASVCAGRIERRSNA